MGFYYYRQLNVNLSQVHGNLASFPVLVSLTLPQLRHTSSGGHVAYADGRDIFVAADSDFSSVLPFELESYNPSTGELVLWALLSSISSTSAPSIWLQYGDASKTWSSATPSSVWANGFSGVWHGGSQRQSNTTISDSTANGNVGTAPGGLQAGVGKISSNSGLVFKQGETWNGVDAYVPDYSITIPDSPSLRPQKYVTLSGWVNSPAVLTGGPDSNDSPRGLYFGRPSIQAACTFEISQDANYSPPVIASIGGAQGHIILGNISAHTWTYFALTWDGATLNLYVNGSLMTSANWSGSFSYPQALTTPLIIGNVAKGLNGLIIDEVRFASATRTPEWIATEYANQNVPSTFITAGVEQSFGPQAISLSGVPSAESFGSPSAFPNPVLSEQLTAIQSAETFGTLTLSIGDPPDLQRLQLSSIPSVETLGSLSFVGSYTILLSGMPDETAMGEVRIKRLQIAPTLTWVSPSPISEDTPLDHTQLRAQANAPGAFIYNPPLGTILPPGVSKLSAAFTPRDTDTFTSSSISVNIKVIGEASALAAFPVNFKYRRMDGNGDYVLTGTTLDYHRNTPAAVAQAVKTGLGLWTGEWFLNVAEGTPWATGVLATGTKNTYDQIIKDQILNTAGVTEIVSYSSTVDPAERKLTVTCTINTLFGGQTSLNVALNPAAAATAPLASQETANQSAPVMNMKYRKLDANGDYVLTGTGKDYFANTPAGVAQAVKTRLGLWTGEWYLDLTDGTAWNTIIGKGNQQYDVILKDRCLTTPGVTQINSWSSSVDPATRKLSIAVSIDTLYGPATFQTTV